jgi:hypothetical protein
VRTIVAIEDLEVHQMDVKIVFLNGDILEEIYATTRRLCGQG